MNVSYIKDGRPAALAAMAIWLEANYPRPTIAYVKNIGAVPKARRLEILNEKIKEFNQRAKINVAWRDALSDRLHITIEDVVRCTNTIIELMEKTLAFGDTVRISNLGDFKPINIIQKGILSKAVRFYADEDWKKSLNEPLYMKDLGLLHKVVKKKLQRRKAP